MVDPNGSVGRRRTEVLFVMLAILAFLVLLLLYRARAGSSSAGLGAHAAANPASTEVSLLLPANPPTFGALDIPAPGLAASPTSTTAPPAPAPAGGSGASRASGASATGGGQHQATAPARTPVTSPSRATSAPTCAISAFHYSPPPAQQFATVESEAGLASISGVSITNGTVSVAAFRSGTKATVQVTATKADPTLPTQWSFVATDVLGRATVCQ